MWEIRYIDYKTKEIIVIRRVSEFTLARTIAVNLPKAKGKYISIHKPRPSCNPRPRYDVWLWVIESKEWVRLKGRPMTKRGTMQFHARFDPDEAVPDYWPVGTALPPYDCTKSQKPREEIAK